MFPVSRWFVALGLAVLGLLVVTSPAAAQKDRPVPYKGVKDDAKLFSESAVRKAREEIAEIKRRTGKDLLIETVESPPAVYQKKKAKEYAEEWAERNFKDLGVSGVYVLISKEPGILQPVVGNQTRASGLFSGENRNQLGKLMLARLREAKEAAKENDEKKAQELRDLALLDGVNYVHDNMKAAARAGGAAGTPKGKAQAGGAPAAQSIWSGPMGWICIGLVVLLVVWLIIGIIRALSGSGSPGYGGAGGGGGGGGGGFFSGLLGGLFGAMAGMWLYNNLFGGHTPSAFGGEPGGGGGGGEDVADTSGDAGGGGDWGGDAGGDAGGGGGDWGGGGGDWGGGDAGGGGGGDWGGGGGDWGGGGGGDFGGGGGDW